MSHFRRITAMRTRIALDNPGATDRELDELFNAELAGAAAEGRFDNPYFVGLDEDEPKDHAYNNQPPWCEEFYDGDRDWSTLDDGDLPFRSQ